MPPEFFDTVKDALERPAPRVSQETIEYERGLLNNPAWRQEHPREAEALRASLETALAMTAQNEPAHVDTRTPQQRLHDHVHAIEPMRPDDYRDLPPTHREFAAALSLPPHLASLVVRDALSGSTKADPAAYTDAIKDAQAALDRAAHLPDASKIKVKDQQDQG